MVVYYYTNIVSKLFISEVICKVMGVRNLSKNEIRTRGSRTNIQKGDLVETHEDSRYMRRKKGRVIEMENGKVTKIKAGGKKVSVLKQKPAWKIKHKYSIKNGEEIMPIDADVTRTDDLLQAKIKDRCPFGNVQTNHYIVCDTSLKGHLVGVKYYIEGQKKEMEVIYQRDLDYTIDEMALVNRHTEAGCINGEIM